MDELGLGGRTCIVTGATRGLGREILRQFVAVGANVLAVGSSAQSCERLQQEYAGSSQVAIQAQDMGAPDAGQRLVEAATKRWSQIDVVVNNAAPFHYLEADEEIGREAWEEIVRVKLLGYWSLMTAAVEHLEATRGSVTNVAGGAGIVASPTSPHVGAINAAIISMSESYALKLAKSGIRVNVVTPNTIENDRFATRVERRAAEEGITLDEARSQLGSRVPIGYPASPVEIGRVVLLLSSPESRSISGTNVIVDGASHLRGHGRSA